MLLIHVVKHCKALSWHCNSPPTVGSIVVAVAGLCADYKAYVKQGLEIYL